jgi:hypothetical protein
VPGATTLQAGSGNAVTLANSSNDFGGAVAITSAKNVNLTDANAISLGASTVSGNLGVEAGTAVSQTGALSVTGTSSLQAGTGAITLANGSNDFGGPVSVPSAGDVSLTDANALAIGASTIHANLSLNASGAITQSAALAVTGATSLSAGGGNSITLSNGSNDFGGAVGVPSALDVSLRDANALALGASTVSGDLTAQGGGAVTQTGPAAVTGVTEALGSPVMLSQDANDFGGEVRVQSSGGGSAGVDDTNDLTVGDSVTGGPFAVTADEDVTVPAGAQLQATGPLRLVADQSNPAPPAVGAGGITVGSGADLTGSGAIRLYGSARSANSIAGNASFNGLGFTPGTLYVDSAREQWGVYSPDGSATAPFTFFYKDGDTTSPAIDLAAPTDGATYEMGQHVNAAYSCTDGGGGTGVKRCEGTTPDGSPIDTSTPGPKSFTVEAESGSGRTSSKTVSYTVADAAKPAISGLRVDPKRFRAGAQPTPLARGAKGASIRLTLSEDATVHFRIRSNPPRRRGNPPPKRARAFSRTLEAGEQSVRFTGTLDGRTFRPGRYLVIAIAVEPSGQSSERATAPFRITG